MNSEKLLPGNLTGSHHVRIVRPAFQDAGGLMKRVRERAELRRQALKLRYWPGNQPDAESGQVLDIDWCWIQACKQYRIGELRVDDVIGGHDNLRVIFWNPSLPPSELPTIWILAVMQKKRQNFTTGNITTFKARRTIALARFYGP